jgi:type VI secretion system (T6SS) effector TldE1-like protein
MWTYSQSTGELKHNGIHVADGYSGNLLGKNNPMLQMSPDIGPIPRGEYKVGHPHHSHHVGPYAMPLSPKAGTETFGRKSFFIHGDSIKHPGLASKGCIILSPPARHRIWLSGDHDLSVTP